MCVNLPLNSLEQKCLGRFYLSAIRYWRKQNEICFRNSLREGKKIYQNFTLPLRASPPPQNKRCCCCSSYFQIIKEHLTCIYCFIDERLYSWATNWWKVNVIPQPNLAPNGWSCSLWGCLPETGIWKAQWEKGLGQLGVYHLRQWWNHQCTTDFILYTVYPQSPRSITTKNLRHDLAYIP